MHTSALERLIQRLSAYGVPVAVAALTLVALLAWEPHYRSDRSSALELRVVEDRHNALDPATAAAALADRAPVAHLDTRLSESPFWFAFDVAPGPQVEVDLPSRHALEAACWQVPGFALLGAASRERAQGAMRAAKAGFVLDLGALAHEMSLVCRARFSGPARLSALQWDRDELRRSSERFHRNAGLIDGGMLLLAAFVLLAAAINRDATYLVFAAWLVASLRLAAISAGWDTHWLERSVPPAWLAPLRQITIAVYILLTYALFSRLFRDDLRRIGHAWALQLARLCCLGLLVAALALPFAQFLPVMWVAAAVGIATLGFLLARILALRPSRVAMWYAAALGVVLAAGLYEVAAAALGAKVLIGAVNSVTAALASSLLASLAIAEQMREERAARVRAESELRGTYEALPIGLFTLERDGTFLRVNPEATRMLGVDPAAAGMRWSDFFPPRAWHHAAEFEVERRAAGEPEPRWFHVRTAPADGKVEGSLQDTTERRRATEKLRFLAENDALTGVMNRRGIAGRIEAELAGLAPGRTLALGYLDLDRFKLINDLFGHRAGDEVLRQVCRRVEELLGRGHALGRIGGDEFVLVFAGTPIRSAAALCRGILEALVGRPYQSDDKAFQVKGSIGLVEVAAGTPVSDAISMADQACRAAKSARGEGGLVVYERGAAAFREREQELRLAKRLSAGVAPEGLFLVMQPILSLRAPLASLDFEMLVRMRDEDGSVVGGGRIMAAAENNGCAAVIDRWVLGSALAWLERHREALGGTRFACMNLSGASLNDERFVREAFELLAAHPRGAARLCIEITESVALHDLGNTRRFIDRVRGCGARVALDDFGAGYTSFSYLKELPADALKIDGQFVRGVHVHPANLAIVEAIAELSRNLGMQSIAEWAEDCATVEALRQAGIDYAQGFVIARPQSPERILAACSAADFVEDAALRRALAGEGPDPLFNMAKEGA